MSPQVVMLVAGLLTLAVLLGMTPKISELISSAATKGVCQWNFALNALIDKPPECDAKFDTVDMHDINVLRDKSTKRIKVYHENAELYSAAAAQFVLESNNEPSKITIMEHSLDKLMAVKAASCWQKVWKGELPLFDRDWDVYDLKNLGFIADDDSRDPGNIHGKELWSFYFLSKNKPPVFCVLCERVKFDKEVQEAFAKEDRSQITSESVWMASNPRVPKTTATTRAEAYDNTPFSEYLQDDVSDAYFNDNFVYDIREPQAVLYLRINRHWVHAPLEWFHLIGEGDKTKPINMITFVPYSEINERCDILVA